MTLPWYPFQWDDYSGSTFTLTQGQHGAHLLFMRHIYTGGKVIPHEQRYSIARALTEQEQANADFVLSAHYKRNGDFWYNTKCETIMKEAQKAHEKRVNAGKKGGKAKASNAKAMPKQSSSNHNHNHNHIDNSNELSNPKPQEPDLKAGFEEFYQTYPHKVGRTHAEKAYHRALKTNGVTHASLIDAVNRFAAAHAAAGTEKRFIPHPATWLNGSRWEDDLSGITSRRHTTQPAANARGSQFNALQSALADLIPDDDQHLGAGRPELSERETWPQSGIPDPGQPGTGLPVAFNPHDQAGGITIDHEADRLPDGGETIF